MICIFRPGTASTRPAKDTAFPSIVINTLQAAGDRIYDVLEGELEDGCSNPVDVINTILGEVELFFNNTEKRFPGITCNHTCDHTSGGSLTLDHHPSGKDYRESSSCRPLQS